MRRHRLIERFLTDVLGVPWDEVHEEAERLEHAMSPVLEERMLAAIGDAKTCPHGHPIVAGTRLPAFRSPTSSPARAVRVLRFENEAEDLPRYLKASGLEPGLEGGSGARRAADRARSPTERCAAHAERRRDGLGDRGPFAAARTALPSSWCSASATGARASGRPQPGVRRRS